MKSAAGRVILYAVRNIFQDFLIELSLSLLPLHVQLSGGEAGQERRSHDGESDYVAAVFEVFRNFRRCQLWCRLIRRSLRRSVHNGWRSQREFLYFENADF